MGLVNQNPAYNIVQNQLFSFTKGETLAECETDIEMTEKMSDAMKGERLGRIKSQKLYKEKFGTWEEYCQRRWSWTPQHANRLIDFAETCMLIKSEPTGSVLPERESQTRALNTLPDEQKTEVWAKAVEAAKGAQPTAEQVKEAAKRNGYVMRYCPNCNHEQHIHASYKHVTVKCPQCHKEAYCDTEWLTQPKTIETTENRYCPKCLAAQTLKAKAIQHNNNVQCSKCFNHSVSKTWLTETELKKIRYCPHCSHKYIMVNPTEKTQCINCSKKTPSNQWLTEPKPLETRYCPKCGEDKREFSQDQLTKIAQMAQCKKCSHRCAPKYWTTEPKTIQTRYCPYCYEEKPVSTADIQNQWYLKCKNRACGKETMAGNWLTKAPTKTASPTKMHYCTYCHRGQIVNLDELTECNHCHKKHYLWAENPYSDSPSFLADPAWQIELKPDKKDSAVNLTTPMYCPKCEQTQDILNSWLNNESTMNQGTVKCEHCQTSSRLKLWYEKTLSRELNHEWTEETLKEKRGELKSNFSRLVNQFCTNEETWYKFDKILLKLHQYLINPDEKSRLDSLITTLTAP